MTSACGSGASHVATTTSASVPRSAALWAPPGTAALSASTAAALQVALKAWVAQGKLTGITAAVVTPTGMWSGAVGVDAAGTALRPDSALSIMSISKTFTAAEVMLLVSRHLVDLDKPIANYVTVPFDTQGATVRQVLSMRSGLPDYPTNAEQAAIAADLNREWTASEMLATVPAGSPRLGSRGGGPRYGGVNYQLLAELVANVTKQSFAKALRADLIDPAGLRRTWVQSGESPAAPLTVGGKASHADLVDPAGPFMPSRSFASFVLGAGSIAADAADTARWGYLLYGGQVIDSTLVKQMEADPQLEPSLNVNYALGTMVSTDDNGATMVGHSGGGPDWPYTAVLQVWTGNPPIAIAVLTPQPADFGNDIYDGFMHLHAIVTAGTG